MTDESRFKKFCFLLIFFAAGAFSGRIFCQNQTQSVITIESADKSEYKKDSVSGDDCIILSGAVAVSVSRGNDKTLITADSVNYNRTSEMLYAEGNVSLKQTGSSGGGETIFADSLLFNTSTLEGVFDNGRAVQTSSDAINLPSGSTLIVASNVFGRDSGGTVAFKSGELTFCDDENPHWKIKASRIWLLPGGEFAFFNALLFVGKIPLMYFPAFYYPKDELIFNPAMGYKYREGYFINTTTYLYGRKPADAASTKQSSSDDEKVDLFSFMKTGQMKEQVREGLVLHNLDGDFTGDTVNHVKIMADYYTNMGGMVGADVVLKPEKILNSFSANVEIGFSNTVFKQSDGTYLPFGTDGKKEYNRSNFLELALPFRYQTKLEMSVSTPLSLSLSLPVYSDPYFDYDFNSRAETMDWIDFLMSGAPSDSDISISSVSSFSWLFNGSYTFKLPQRLNPYISTLSISNFSSSVDFSSKTNVGDSEISSYSPEREFYYPSKISPFKISGRIAGTVFEYPSKKQAASAVSSNVSLIPPETLNDAEKKEETPQSENSESAGQTGPFDENSLPVISVASPSIKNINGVTYKLSYSIVPDFSSLISYASSYLKTPADFAWSDVQSTFFQFKSPTTLTSALGLKDGFLSLTDTLNFQPTFQKHPYLSENQEKGGYSETNIESIKKTDYQAKKLDLTGTNALSFKPFYYSEYFSGTSLTWNTTVKMIQTKYISDDIENPDWEYLTIVPKENYDGNGTDHELDDIITAHNLNLVLSAKEGGYGQQLSLTTTLPPQVDQYSGIFSLTFPYASFSVGTGIKQKSRDEPDVWVKNNISQSFSLKLFSNKLSLTQSYVYNWEDKEHDSMRLSLSGFGAQLAYTMSYSSAYEFDEKSGWKSLKDKVFQPYSMSLAYSSGTKKFSFLNEKISFSPSLNTSFVYDFVRPTGSYFVFIPSVTFKLNNILDLTFSSESRNSGVYRYFCSDEDFDYYYKSSGYRNLFEDLFDSFRFDSESKRKESNFKLKNLKVTLTHDLDDWDLNLECTIKPRLITNSGGKRAYDFSPYFSVSVSWRPMAGMKTEIVDEYGEWHLE